MSRLFTTLVAGFAVATSGLALAQDAGDTIRYGDRTYRFYRANPTGRAALMAPAEGGADTSGFFDPRFMTTGNATIARTEFLLPAPTFSNDLFHAPSNPQAIRLGHAYALEGIGLSEEPSKDLLTRFNASPSFGIAYDTGVAPLKFSADKVALGDDIKAGQTTFSGSDGIADVPLTMLLDTQIMDLGSGQGQFYIEGNTFQQDRDLNAAHLYARYWDKDSLSLLVGKTYSLFSINGLAPATISQGTMLTGTSGRTENVRQLRLQYALSNTMALAAAVEEPDNSDFTLGTQQLTRWPAFSARLAYRREGESHDNFAVSSIVRSLGYQNAGNTDEYFTTGWGLAAVVREVIHFDDCTRGSFYAGAAGGDGLGNYIQGIGIAASTQTATTGISSLGSFGAYIGYRHEILMQNGWELAANAAYGCAFLDETALVPDMTNREIHQAWANLIASPNNNVAFGLEYQFGSREVFRTTPGATDSGDDHRFMFVVALRAFNAEKAAPTVVNGRELRFQPLQDGAPAAQVQAAETGTRGNAYLNGL